MTNEESKGLWANIRAKRARGEKPARKGSDAYNKAVAAAKKINATNEITICKTCALALMEDIKAGAFELNEAEHKGKKVTLGKVRRTPGGPKKFSVYVKNDKGNVVKVNFGDPGLSIKRDDPERRKAYRARHHCDNPGPRWKANYWSCRNWSSKPVSKIVEDSKTGAMTGTQEKEFNTGLRSIHMNQADMNRWINSKTPHSKINYGGCGMFAKLLYYNMRKYLNITPEIILFDTSEQLQDGEINKYPSLQDFNRAGHMCVHIVLKVGDYYIDSSGVHKFSWFTNVYGGWFKLTEQTGMTIQTLSKWVSSANSWNPTFNRESTGEINKAMVDIVKHVAEISSKK